MVSQFYAIDRYLLIEVAVSCILAHHCQKLYNFPFRLRQSASIPVS